MLHAAGRYGDGYFPFVTPDLDPFEALAQILADMHVEADRQGRDAGAIEITVGGARSVEDAEKFKAQYAANVCVATRPYPGIVDLLDHYGAVGTPLAVVTNKPGDLAGSPGLLRICGCIAALVHRQH